MEKQFRAIAVFALAMTCLVIGLDSYAQTAEERVVIRQYISLDYEAEGNNFEDLVELADRTPVRISDGDTVSGLIADNYSIDKRYSPESYAVLEDLIVQQNNLRSADFISSSGILSLPVLPPIALREPNSINPNLSIPKTVLTQEFAERSAALSPRLAELFSQSRTTETGLLIDEQSRRGAQYATLFNSVSVQQAIEFNTRVEDLGFEGKVNYLFRINLDYEQIDAASDPDGNELSAIRSLVELAHQNETRHQPILIVLDDGWGGEFNKTSSFDLLADIFSEIEERFDIPYFDYYPDSPLNRPDSYTADQKHSEQIAASLEEISVDGAVDVIYLPILPIDEQADLIFHRMFFDMLYLFYRGEYGEDFELSNRPVVESNLLLSIETDLANLSANLADEDCNDAQCTSSSLVQGVAELCSTISLIASRPCFINMSWTVPNLILPVSFPDNPFRGLYVTAIGNQNSGDQKSLTETRYQFASRIFDQRDTIGVANGKNGGQRQCASRTFGDFEYSVIGTSMNGFVSSGVCGTSFASPRVAYLLAARERCRPHELGDPSKWRRQTEQEFKFIPKDLRSSELPFHDFEASFLEICN